MGYRSDAALATRRKYYDEMLRTAKTQDDSEAILSFLTTDADCTISGDGDDAVVILQWGWIKWYRELSDVGYVERWMDGDFDGEFEYSFIRIGQETDDIEVRNDYNFSLDGLIYISRAIDIDVDTSPFTPVIPCDPPEDDADLPENTDFSISDFLNIKEDL